MAQSRIGLLGRVGRHLRIMRQRFARPPSPPFLILFVTSLCNMRCAHCFYWRELNSRDDLSKEEILQLSRDLGRIENLNLSGGEPFLRPDLAEICQQFTHQNGVRQIYIPTNGFFTERIVAAVTQMLAEKELELLAIELSLDGMPAFHNTLRNTEDAFGRALRTYDALAEIQQRDVRLRLHAASTATSENLDEIRRLTTFLYNRCPQMDHHNLAIIRGDHKNRSLLAPAPDAYLELYRYMQRLWQPREKGRYGAIVEPITQWAKLAALRQRRQAIPCLAGKLSAVVYANGDVSICELHEPLGNLRQHSFRELWDSPEAWRLRRTIARRECFCTTEVFLWPSIVFQPLRLLQALWGAHAWQQPRPLAPEEQIAVELTAIEAAATSACPGQGGGPAA